MPSFFAKASPGYAEMEPSLEKLRKYFSMFGREEYWYLFHQLVYIHKKSKLV